MQLFEPALLFSLAISAYALRNVTVDDTNGDEATGNQIIYQPADIWQLGQSCTNCTAKLDPNQAYDSTWHDSSYFPPGTSAFDSGQFPNASYTFNGESIVHLQVLTLSDSESSREGLAQAQQSTSSASYSVPLRRLMGTPT